MTHAGEDPPRPTGPLEILTCLDGMRTDPVEPERCLLTGVPADRPMEEFFSEAAGGRTIALPTEGVDGRIHRKLADRGLPILRRFGAVNGLDLLRVPPGARTIGSVLHLIGEDLPHFGELLWRAGEIQGQLMATGFGVLNPDPRLRLLERLALVPAVEQQDPRVVLVPPYDFQQVGAPIFNQRIYQELAVSGYFDDDTVHYLAEQARLGMEQGYGPRAPGTAAA